MIGGLGRTVLVRQEGCSCAAGHSSVQGSPCQPFNQVRSLMSVAVVLSVNRILMIQVATCKLLTECF